MKKDVNIKDVNSYVAEDNDKGMEETVLNIIKNGKKVKIHGNEFDFYGIHKDNNVDPRNLCYKEERFTGKMKINGKEIDVNIRCIDGYPTIELKKDLSNYKDFDIFVNKKKFIATSVYLRPDLSVKKIVNKNNNQTFIGRDNCYQYDFDDNDYIITNHKQQLCKEYKFNGIDVSESIELDENNRFDQDLSKEKEKLLKRVIQEQTTDAYYIKEAFFNGDKAYIVRYGREDSFATVLCYKLENDDEGHKKYGETDYGEIDLREEIRHCYPPMDIGDNKLIIEADGLISGEQYLYVVNATNNQIATIFTDRDTLCNGGFSPKRINFKNGRIYSKEKFDKMLKKYFDKCVKKEQKKENNLQNNKDDKNKQNDLYNNQKAQETQNGEVKNTERKKDCVIF